MNWGDVVFPPTRWVGNAPLPHPVYVNLGWSKPPLEDDCLSRPEALRLPEGNRVAALKKNFFFNVSSFAFLRNGVGSWKSLEGFHKQLSLTVRWCLLVETRCYFFFPQKENNMPVFTHQKGLDHLLLGEALGVSNHGQNSYLAVSNGLSGSDCS